MHLRWLAPEEQNGPSPVYQLERREPSLPAPRAMVMKGTRFTGHGYYTVEPSDETSEDFSTGPQLDNNITGNLDPEPPRKAAPEFLTLRKECEVTQSCLPLCDPMEPIRLLYPWNFSGKDTGVVCHFLLQGIFPTQGSNPGGAPRALTRPPQCP